MSIEHLNKNTKKESKTIGDDRPMSHLIIHTTDKEENKKEDCEGRKN